MPSSAAHSTGVQLGTCLWPLVHSFISKSQRSGTLALDTVPPNNLDLWPPYPNPSILSSYLA